MTGLRLMNELMDPATRETVVQAHTASGNGFGVTTTVSVREIPKVTRSPRVRTDLPIPRVATLERKVRLVPDLREVWSYINPFMLYGRHMGFRGDFEKRLEERDPKAVELFESMEEVRRGRGIHEDPRGVAIFRGGGRRRLPASLSRGVPISRCIRFDFRGRGKVIICV